MHLFIHTLGRVNKQDTLKFLSQDLRNRLFFVIQEKELDKWSLVGKPAGSQLLVLPPAITTLSPTRQYILEYAAGQGMDKIVMMDDDLRFSKRDLQAKAEEKTKLHQASPAEVQYLFDCILEDALDEHCHAGVSAREGNNHNEQKYARITRMMRVLAYRPKAVLDLGCRFDRLCTKQDFDMTLQLLRAGKPNYVTYAYAQDQGGSQVSGGCATYRTPQMMAEDSYHLANLHPGFVKVVLKETKGAWGGGVRTDVTIAWKKAFLSSGVEDNWREP